MQCYKCQSEDSKSFYGCKEGWLCSECGANFFREQLIRLRKRYSKLSKKLKESQIIK